MNDKPQTENRFHGPLEHVGVEDLLLAIKEGWPDSAVYRTYLNGEGWTDEHIDRWIAGDRPEGWGAGTRGKGQ